MFQLNSQLSNPFRVAYGDDVVFPSVLTSMWSSSFGQTTLHASACDELVFLHHVNSSVRCSLAFAVHSNHKSHYAQALWSFFHVHSQLVQYLFVFTINVVISSGCVYRHLESKLRLAQDWNCPIARRNKCLSLCDSSFNFTISIVVFSLWHLLLRLLRKEGGRINGGRSFSNVGVGGVVR